MYALSDEGFFIALVVIGKKSFETELMLSRFSSYIQNIYHDNISPLTHHVFLNIAKASLQ